MADLARIKRNVAKMASMNAPEEDIDGYIASEGVTIEDVRNYRELQPMTDEQKAKAQKMAQQMRPKKTTGGKVSEFLVTNPIARQVGFGLQGIANAGLNPAGYVARAAGIDTKPLEAQTAGERATELAGQYGFDSAALVPALGLAAGSIPKIAPYAQAITEGGVPLALTTSAGGAIAEGIANPTNDFERFLANMAGGGIAGGVIGGLRRTATNTAGGLKEALPNERANAALSKGITADKGVAKTISKEAPAVYDELNADMTQALNKATGRKLNIEQANQNARNAYENYIAQNADYPIFNPKSAKEQADENFKRWFEGSQVVDENGQPLKLYHGTRADFDTFDLGKSGQSNGGISKIGVWLTPEEQIAKEFSNTWYGGDNPRVMQTYVNMKNPKVYKSVDNTKALKKIESDIDNVNNKMQKIRDRLSNSELSQLRGFMQYDDYDEIAKMYGYSPETAKNAKDYWSLDKQLDDLLFEQRNLKANDAYDQLLNDLDEYSEFIMHTDGVKDFRRGSHTSRISITNPDEAVAKLKDRLKKEGYDGIIVENTNRDTDVIGKNASQYVAFNPNQIKSVNNSGAWSSSPSLSDAGWKAEPSIKDIKLNQYQQNAMNKALAEGASMSDYPLGSLDATHKAQGVLNDMINASYDSSNPLKPRATTETSQLMSLKKVFNELMEPSGVKPLDARISKAKTLRSNFEKGYNFKPSETKFDNLGLNTARDKKAFLQGRLAKLQDNVLSEGGTNLADAVIKDQNTIKKLMPKKQFNYLMNTAGSLKESFNRLKSIEGQANRELLKDIERGGSPWRENIESKGSLIGRALDVTSNALNKGSRRRLAEAYLNPEISEIRQFGGVKGALKGAGSASLRQALIGNKEK